MYHIHCLNTIPPKGTRLFSENYTFTDRIMEANAVLVRSANMHTVSFPDSLLAVSRAGAGVNNIPIPLCTESGIVVFNTPGANANAVVELAICGLLLGSRDILGGVEWVKKLTHSSSIANEVEKEKGRFAGQEIAGRSLGVIGLGAIGGSLANHAIRLGMDVYGYDPYLSIDGVWHLDSQITHMNELKELYERCDYISLHIAVLVIISITFHGLDHSHNILIRNRISIQPGKTFDASPPVGCVDILIYAHRNFSCICAIPTPSTQFFI